jgi:hypothetical protein
MKLCFGSFATVLTLCKVISATNQQLCGTILLSVAPPKYDLREDPDVTSKLIRGERNLSPKNVATPAQSAKPHEVAGYFKRAVVPLLDENQLELVVLALKDIVANDESVQSKTTIDKVGGATKESLASKTEFCFHEFLAGVFLYVAINSKIKESDRPSVMSSIKEIDHKYINSFAVRKGEITLISSSRDFSAEFADDLTSFPQQTEDLLLLQEVESHCPLCRDFLVHQKDGVALRNYKITPIAALSGSATNRSLKSQSGDIALCLRCAGEYLSRPTVAEYLKLSKIKQAVSDRRRALENAVGIKIDEQIEEVLRAITNTTKEQLALKMEPAEVEKNIEKDKIPLMIKIMGYVTNYFYRVRDILQGLDHDGRLRSKEIAEDVNAYYKKLRRGQFSQERILMILVVWLQTNAETDYHLACEILVSFFVQDCEVFDVIAQ